MDLTSLPPELLGIGSGWTLTGLAVWMILTGRLVPKSFLDRAEHDAQEWRTEGRIKDQQIGELSESLRTLGGAMSLVETTMRTIQQQSGRSGPEEP